MTQAAERTTSASKSPPRLRLPPDTPYVEEGWRVKVLWLVTERQKDPVTLEATPVAEGEPALVELVGR